MEIEYDDYISEEKEAILHYLEDKMKRICYSVSVSRANKRNNCNEFLDQDLLDIKRCVVKKAIDEVDITDRIDHHMNETIYTGKLIVMNEESWREAMDGIKAVLGVRCY